MSAIADRYFEKALGAVKARDYDRALKLLVEAIKLKPLFAEAWVVRGNVLHSQDRHFDALLHYDRALEANPNLHDAWNNRGIAFADIGMFSAAEDSFRKSAALMPAVEPHIGLANMYCTLMRLDEAADEYREAMRIDPGCLDAQINYGICRLGQGKWMAGFYHYELRWRNTPYPPPSLRNYIKWTGHDLNGKTLLLYPEQGYGDEIMSLRFARGLLGRYPDAKIIIQARAPMLRMVQKMVECNDRMSAVSMHGDDPPVADYSLPLLDVPMAVGIYPDAVLATQYLEAPDKTQVADFKSRLGKLPPGLNVGLCWSSGSHLDTARAGQAAKSIPIEWLKPLQMKGVNLISLQKPHEPTPPEMQIADWMDECHDFADTAALIEALDLIISVDTAVAHLAGAMGKPVWNFVRFSGYWPWLTPSAAGDETKSIWYSKMKLLRQPSLANWDVPINNAVRWLQAEVREREILRDLPQAGFSISSGNKRNKEAIDAQSSFRKTKSCQVSNERDDG